MKSMYDIMKHEKVEGQYSTIIDWSEIWKKAFIDPESSRELQVGSAGPFSEKTNGFWAQASIQIMQHIVLATTRSWTLQSNYSAS